MGTIPHFSSHRQAVKTAWSGPGFDLAKASREEGPRGGLLLASGGRAARLRSGSGVRFSLRLSLTGAYCLTGEKKQGVSA
jgi:hypothetical protein